MVFFCDWHKIKCQSDYRMHFCDGWDVEYALKYLLGFEAMLMK